MSSASSSTADLTCYAENLEGDTPYGDAFHGYVLREPGVDCRSLSLIATPIARFWVTDIHKLNPHFGNEEDLKALSKALHDRGM